MLPPEEHRTSSSVSAEAGRAVLLQGVAEAAGSTARGGAPRIACSPHLPHLPHRDARRAALGQAPDQVLE